MLRTCVSTGCNSLKRGEWCSWGPRLPEGRALLLPLIGQLLAYELLACSSACVTKLDVSIKINIETYIVLELFGGLVDNCGGKQGKGLHRVACTLDRCSKICLT